MTKSPPEDEPQVGRTPSGENEETVGSFSDSGVKFRRNIEIGLPKPSEDLYLAIRWSEWDAIQRDVVRAKQPEYAFLAILWPLFFGMAATAGFSIIPVLVAKTVLPPWVESFYILGTGFFLVLGSVMVVLHRKMKKAEGGKLDDILANMKRIGDGIKKPSHRKEGPGQAND